ncbi:MAG TPA: DUF6504 family protein [Marmoricola sp.]|nr:DUF6504 family protein [Marmoricola sp.]
MRRYDDPVDVSQGVVAGLEGPAQFIWRDRIWQVREVVAHWVETGAWWRSATAHDLLAERETWRVVARRTSATGVFDLRFDWADGSWRLIGCLD